MSLSRLVEPREDVMDVLVLDFLYLPEVVDCLVQLLHFPGNGLYLAPLSAQLPEPAAVGLFLLVEVGEFEVVVVEEGVVALEFVELKAPDTVLLQHPLVRFPQRPQLLSQPAHIFFSLRCPAPHLASVLLLHDVLSLGEDGLFLERQRLLLLGFAESFELGLKLSNTRLFILQLVDVQLVLYLHLLLPFSQALPSLS